MRWKVGIEDAGTRDADARFLQQQTHVPTICQTFPHPRLERCVQRMEPLRRCKVVVVEHAVALHRNQRRIGRRGKS